MNAGNERKRIHCSNGRKNKNWRTCARVEKFQRRKRKIVSLYHRRKTQMIVNCNLHIFKFFSFAFSSKNRNSIWAFVFFAFYFCLFFARVRFYVCTPNDKAPDVEKESNRFSNTRICVSATKSRWARFPSAVLIQSKQWTRSVKKNYRNESRAERRKKSK